MTRPIYPTAFGDPPHLAALERKAAAATCDGYLVTDENGNTTTIGELRERQQRAAAGTDWPRDVLLPCGTRVPAGVIAEWSRGVFCEVDLLLAAVVGMLRSMPQGRV